MEEKNTNQNVGKKVLETTKKVIRKIAIRVSLLVLVIVLVAAFVLNIFQDKAKKASQFGEKINEAYTIEGNEIKIKDEAIDKIIADLESNESYERVANRTVNEIRNGRKNTLDTIYLCDKLPPETDLNKDEIQEMKRKYIRMFMQAELVTQEVNRGGIEQPGKAYGRVYIKRTNSRDTSQEGTQTKELTYKPLAEFQALINSGNMNAEKYFSVDDSGKLLISSWSRTTINGTVTSFAMTTRTIDYKALISQYSVPYEFLIDLCMQTQSTQFMIDFVNRIFNSRIEITIQDIYTEATTVETITYDNKTETLTKSQTETTTSTGEVSYSPENPEYPSSPTVTVTPATPEVTTTLLETVTPSAVVTYAKTWFIEQKMNYTNTVNTTQNAEGTPNPGVDYPLEDEIGEWIENGPSITVISTPDPTTGTGNTVIKRTWTKQRKSKINRNKNIAETTTTNTYSPGLAVDPISYEDEIIKLLEKKYPVPSTNKYVYPGGNLKSSTEMFFILLQTSSRTQGAEQIMRFILQKYTGKDFGVDSLDSLLHLFEQRMNRMARDIIVDITRCDAKLVISDVNVLKQAFTGYSGSSELIRHAQDFLDMQNQYKVNALFAAAVSITETSAGRAGNAVNGLNNWFNIRGEGGSWRPFTSAKEGIARFGWQIAQGSYYFTAGNYSVGTIGPIYCPNDEAHPTQADDWVADTIARMIEFYEAAGIDVSGLIGGDASAVAEFALQFEGEGHSRFTTYKTTDGWQFWGDNWCAMFVSYCFDNCGLIPSVLPKSYVGCGTACSDWMPTGQIVSRQQYPIPKSGDIIFYARGSDIYHTGIVTDCDGTYVYTIEGNSGSSGTSPYWMGSKVTAHKISINAGNIYAYFVT